MAVIAITMQAADAIRGLGSAAGRAGRAVASAPLTGDVSDIGAEAIFRGSQIGAEIISHFFDESRAERLWYEQGIRIADIIFRGSQIGAAKISHFFDEAWAQRVFFETGVRTADTLFRGTTIGTRVISRVTAGMMHEG